MFIVGGVKSIVSAVKSIVRPLTMDFIFEGGETGLLQVAKHH